MSISCLVVTGHSDLPETHLLIGLFQAGIELEVLCPADAPNRSLLLDVGVPVFELKLKGRFDCGGIKIIKHHLDIRPVDILHAFNNKALANALIASRGYPCKIIAYRGIEGNVSYYDPMSWLTYLHPRVDKIVCVADAIRQYFWNIRLLGFKLPVKKALTIYKGHDPEWYKNKSTPLDTFSVPEGVFVVGCTVNDRPRKGLVYLIGASKLLPKNLPIHFVLIGRVSNKNLLRDIETSVYANNIHLAGFQECAPAIIKNCDVCILPAIKREGLPKAIIEGMIQGVAPIVTNSGGSPELIEEGDSGLIIPPGSSQAIADAIMALYSNKERLNKIKLKAQQRIIESFSIQETIKQHLNLYKNILS